MFLAADNAYYGRGTGMRDRARLILLYKASDTSVLGAGAVIIRLNISPTAFAFTLCFGYTAVPLISHA